MSRHDHLLRPGRLLALTYDVVNDCVIVKAETAVGAQQIDLHELHAYEGDEVLTGFDGDERRLIEAFQSMLVRAAE